jgi:hypothetical protein
MSLADPLRCTRGPQCENYDPDMGQSTKLTRDNLGGFCRECRAKHRGWYRTSSDERWMGKATEAIEMVFAQKPTPLRPPKATLRDLLDLDSRNDISESDTDLGDVLRLLDAKTLGTLEHFLKEHCEEAINRQYCSGYHYTYLCSVVGMAAAHSSLPLDKPLPFGKADTPSGEVIRTRRGYVVDLASPNNAPSVEIAYIGSGRRVNLKTPIEMLGLADALREHDPRITQRAIEDTIEEVLRVPRSTQKWWRKRMEEVGMTREKFSDAQLQYVVLGKRRGPKPQP